MSWPTAVQNHLTARQPFYVRHLLWCRPQPFGGGARVGFGLWTGDDHEVIAVEGEARTYYGAQGGLVIPPARFRQGTEIAETQVGIVLSPEGETLVRGYNTRLAPFQLHWAVYDANTMKLLGIRRMFTGLVEGISIPTPEQDGAARPTTIDLVSAARWGTTTVNGHKSDASQRLRNPNDTFRVDSSLGHVASDTWAGKD